MASISDLRLSKNMKYTALYVSMRFHEHEEGIFEKTYFDGTIIEIESNNQTVRINGKVSFILDTHESFVKLECINRLLGLNYSINDFELRNNGLYFKKYHVCFLTWDSPFFEMKKNKEVQYKSRLVSGVLEYKTKIKDGNIFDYGLFETKTFLN